MTTDTIGFISISKDSAYFAVSENDSIRMIESISNCKYSDLPPSKRTEKLREIEVTYFYNLATKRCHDIFFDRCPVEKLLISGPAGLEFDFGKYLPGYLQKKVNTVYNTDTAGKLDIEKVFLMFKDDITKPRKGDNIIYDDIVNHENIKKQRKRFGRKQALMNMEQIALNFIYENNAGIILDREQDQRKDKLYVTLRTLDRNDKITHVKYTAKFSELYRRFDHADDITTIKYIVQCMKSSDFYNTKTKLTTITKTVDLNKMFSSDCTVGGPPPGSELSDTTDTAICETSYVKDLPQLKNHLQLKDKGKRLIVTIPGEKKRHVFSMSTSHDLTTAKYDPFYTIWENMETGCNDGDYRILYLNNGVMDIIRKYSKSYIVSNDSVQFTVELFDIKLKTLKRLLETLVRARHRPIDWSYNPNKKRAILHIPRPGGKK